MINTALIEELRIERKLTQEDIAHKLGYANKTAYNKKINNKGSSFTVEDIAMLCQILQVEPNDLILY